MSVRPPTQPIRDASLAEINQALGRARGTAPGIVRVSGTNPEKITCDDIVIRSTLLLHGHVAGRFVLHDGSATDPALQFVNSGQSTGFFSQNGSIGAVVNGDLISSWTTSGLAIPRIYGPAGTIDCGGSALINVGSIIINPGAYELVSNPVQTVGVASAVAIDIPTIAPTTGMSANLDCVIRMTYVSLGSGGSISGSREFRSRIYQSHGAGSPVVGAPFEIIVSESAALLGCAASIAVGANKAQVIVTGVVGHTINWQTSVRVVRVES